MRVLYTPRSHFARKVRILVSAHKWTEKVQFQDIGDASVNNSSIFGSNPLMKVPTLITESGQHVYDSDNIAMFLVNSLLPSNQDDYHVNTKSIPLLNARAVMNGVMAADAELVLGRRTGIDTSKYIRYEKHLSAIRQGLAWLELHHTELFSSKPTYSSFHLVSMWDHLALYNITSLNEFKSLSEHVNDLSRLDYVRSTAPPSFQ
jgi:glutathione S-transferase